MALSGLMGVGEVIAIIERRRAKFRALRRSGPQENMDEAALLIADEYHILLAEIAVALDNTSEDGDES